MMEKELAAFRKAYARRVRITFSLIFFCGIVAFVNLGMEIAGQPSVSMLNVMGNALMLAMYFTGKNANIAVLKDDEKLREAYLSETDERNIAIRAKAGQPVVQWLSAGLMMAYGLLMLLIKAVPMERETKLLLLGACDALTAAAVVQVCISWGLKKYWEKRM